MSENKDAEMKKQEREQIVELGSDITKSSKGSIYTLTIIGQEEGHMIATEACSAAAGRNRGKRRRGRSAAASEHSGRRH